METQTTAPPDPASLVFAVPDHASLAENFRDSILDVWIDGARTAGHPIAEFLRPGSPDQDPTGRWHCGTARIGSEAFEVYARDTLNQVYAVRVDGPNARALLGLDQQSPTADTYWVTRTAAELVELVERARNLLHTNVGNDVERDAIASQADAVAIIAALLPAWAGRELDPATQDAIEIEAAQLTHLVDELDG